MAKGDNTRPGNWAKFERQLGALAKRVTAVERTQEESTTDLLQLTDLTVRIEARAMRLRRVVAKHETRITKLEKSRAG